MHWNTEILRSVCNRGAQLYFQGFLDLWHYCDSLFLQSRELTNLTSSSLVGGGNRNSASEQARAKKATNALHVIHIVLGAIRMECVLNFVKAKTALRVTLAIVRKNRSSSVLPSQNRIAVALITKLEAALI